MKIALALIVKGVDSEADVLFRCLNNTTPHVDGLFITITHKKGEDPSQKVIDVATDFGANISYFEWINDFAAARNFNFSQVPKEFDYILWCDADDVFRGIENLKATIESKNGVDAFAMFYLYWFDEYNNPIVVHQKTQVVKNDGCVEWKGQLHEDFKANRDLERFLIQGIERMHLSNDERASVAKDRNLEVALDQLVNLPSDPRTYWNCAQAYKAINDHKNANKFFAEYLSRSTSEEEKYIARIAMSESLYLDGRRFEAIECVQTAIGSRPLYPDAYFRMGLIYEMLGNNNKAEEYMLLGLERVANKPPYTSIMVYNPRDYDYVPMKNLARLYVRMGRPDNAVILLEGCLKVQPKDEKLKEYIKELKKQAKSLDKLFKQIEAVNKEDKDAVAKLLKDIPKGFQSHPLVCRLRNTTFIKEKSSGKDIAYYCGYTAEEWTPETAAKKGIGGSEEAVIWISKLLAKRGYNITVYNNCGHEAKEFDSVVYKPFWEFNPRDAWDVVVWWRAPMYANVKPNAKKVFVDLHDVVENGEFTQDRLQRIDKVFVKSNFHKSLFPNVPEDKFVVVPNGIDSGLFAGDHEKDPYLLINTSSPDRSLQALVEAFPKIKKAVPEAKLVWAYGWGVFDTAHESNKQMIEWKDKMVRIMNEYGIENVGRLSHGEVAELYKKATIFAYPSEFAEIDCISLTKAMAAGCYPITTDFSAMGEKSGHGGVFVHSNKTKDNWCPPGTFQFGLEDNLDEWTDAVIKTLKEGVPNTTAMREYANTYDWERVVDVWERNLV